MEHAGKKSTMRMPYKVSDFEFASQLFLLNACLTLLPNQLALQNRKNTLSLWKSKVRNNKLNPKLIQSDMTFVNCKKL